jgi:hypothetical protein
MASDRAVKALIGAVFGPDGLTSCNDAVSFDATARRIQRDLVSTVPPQLAAYYERRVEPLLRSNVDCGNGAWTNNACESMNHVLKQYTQWKLQMLPDLTEKLRTLVESQFAEADRALFAHGDFRLAPSHVEHRVSVDSWRSMTAAARQRRRNECFRVLPETRGTQNVTSTDNELLVTYRPQAGKKTNQRKTARAERSTTIKRRRCTARPSADINSVQEDGSE